MLFILFWANLVHADSIVYCDQPGDLFYSPITSKVYLACAGDFSTLDLITIDPLTLTDEYNFYVGGTVDAIVPTFDGLHLLILLSNVDGDTSSNDGVLRKIDSTTGEIVPGYEIEFDDAPLTMVSDNDQTYLYVSWRFSKKRPATINKIRISDFEVMPEYTDYGYKPFSIALSNDDSKLYVINNTLRMIEIPLSLDYYYNIGVFNTADMTMNREINVGDFMPWDMQMGFDHRLFLSFPAPSEGENDNISLIVIDTRIDEIIESINLNEEGIGDISIDPFNQKLYGTFSRKDYFDPEYEEYFHESTELIIQFDLNDLTYTPSFLELGDEGLISIAVAFLPGNSRIFSLAGDRTSPLIYYMDL